MPEIPICFNVLLILAKVISIGAEGSSFILMKEHHVLKGRILEEHYIQSEVRCCLKCLRTSECKGVNILNELDLIDASITGQSLTSLFYIHHQAGKCVTLSSDGIKFILTTACTDLFALTPSSNLFHVPTKKCVKAYANVKNSFITVTSHCNKFTQWESLKDNSLYHVQYDKCVHPQDGLATPGENWSIILYSTCGRMGKLFPFEQVNFVKCQLMSQNGSSSENKFEKKQNWNYFEMN